MMSRGEHYLEAERLLAAAGSATGVGYDRIAAAHVHALLATADWNVQQQAWAIANPPANPPVHVGMRAHDGYVAHSHEVRPDHEGVDRA